MDSFLLELKVGARNQDRTDDLSLTKGVHYHCAIRAFGTWCWNRTNDLRHVKALHYRCANQVLKFGAS